MNVIIRPLQVTDTYKSVKWRNDKEVFKYTGNTYANTITIDSELEWINRVIKNKNEYRCAIEADGVYVGNIYLTDIDENSAQIHIFIGEKEYWGKGIAKQASMLLLKYAFSDLKLNRVYMNVHYKNIASISLYKKFGFVEFERTGDFIGMEIKNE